MIYSNLHLQLLGLNQLLSLLEQICTFCLFLKDGVSIYLYVFFATFHICLVSRDSKQCIYVKDNLFYDLVFDEDIQSLGACEKPQ